MSRDKEDTQFRICMKTTFGEEPGGRRWAMDATRNSTVRVPALWTEEEDANETYFIAPGAVDGIINYSLAVYTMEDKGVDVGKFIEFIQQISSPGVYKEILSQHSPEVSQMIVAEIQRCNPSEDALSADVALAHLNGRFYSMANLLIAIAVAIGSKTFLDTSMQADPSNKILIAVKNFMSQNFPKELNMKEPATNATELLNRLRFAFPANTTTTSAMSYLLADNKAAFKGNVQCPLDDFASWSHLAFGEVLRDKSYAERFKREVFPKQIR